MCAYSHLVQFRRVVSGSYSDSPTLAYKVRMPPFPLPQPGLKVLGRAYPVEIDCASSNLSPDGGRLPIHNAPAKRGKRQPTGSHPLLRHL